MSDAGRDQPEPAEAQRAGSTPSGPEGCGPALPAPGVAAGSIAPVAGGGAPGAGAAMGGSVLTVSGFTLLSRVLGLVRDVLTAALLGTSGAMSAFAAAFAVPNMFRRLFGEGALSAALVPEFVRIDREDPSAAARFLAAALVRLLLGLCVLLGVLEAAIGLVLLLSPADPGRTLSLGLTMALLPYMPLVCAVGLIAGPLQARGRFVFAAAAPLVLNGALILASGGMLALGLAVQTGGEGSSGTGGALAAYVLAGAALVSGVVQAGWAVVAMRRERLLPGPGGAVLSAREHGAALRTVVRRFVPAAIGLGALQLSTLMDVAVAMWPLWVGPTILGIAYPLDVSSNAVLFFAQRLYQFPLGVFGIAVATVVFPRLSRARTDRTAFAGALREGLRLSLFIGLPASVGLVLTGGEIVQAVFGGLGDRFEQPGRVAATLTGYSEGVWAYSLNHVFARACYAEGDTTTPMRLALGGLVLNLALNLLLIWPLGEAGLGWATSATAACQTAVYAVLFTRRLGGGLWGGGLGRSFALTAASGMALALALLTLSTAWPWARSAAGSAALYLLAAVPLGALVHAGIAAAARQDELWWLLRRGRG